MAIYYLIKLLRTNHWGNYGEEKGSFKKKKYKYESFHEIMYTNTS